MKKTTLIVTLTLLAALSAQAATLRLSLVRTSMPDSTWNALTQSIESFGESIETYGGEYGYTYQAQANSSSIDFIYTFSEGWDWVFYHAWRDQFLDIMNANIPPEAGYYWDLSIDGEVSPDSNPWNLVDWLNANIVAYEGTQGTYLVSDTVGWLWTEDWSTDGHFWAYPWSYVNLGWLWVHGGGLYYSLGTNTWFYIVPGQGVAWQYGAESGWVPLQDI